MTDSANDRLIQDILLHAIAIEYATELASTEKVPTSLHFQRQMNQMLIKPDVWVKKRRRPLWQMCIKKVAVFLLICSLIFGSVMATSPTIRAAIIEAIVEWHNTHVIYRFFGESDLSEMPSYDIIELPFGYKTAYEIREVIDSVTVIYENEEGKSICFEYARIGDGSALLLNTENMEIHEIEVREHPGHLYLSADSKESNIVIWYDEQEKIQFMIDGFVNKDELLRAANSITLCKTTK